MNKMNNQSNISYFMERKTQYCCLSFIHWFTHSFIHSFTLSHAASQSPQGPGLRAGIHLLKGRGWRPAQGLGPKSPVVPTVPEWTEDGAAAGPRWPLLRDKAETWAV